MLRRIVAAVAAVAVLPILSPVVTDTARAVVDTGVAAIGETRLPSAIADQGLAVVGGRAGVLTRGNHSIPARLRAAGWVHIGDPDSGPGMVVDAYQGPVGAESKAFGVTYADGSRTLLVHRLVPGESAHNSFVAVAPGARWLVAGEWGTVDRLLVFPLPAGAPAARELGLPLAGVIALNHGVRDLQGCDFRSPADLLCSTDDTSTALFPVTRQLLSIQLRHPVGDGPATASVHLVGSVPVQDVCTGSLGEVEGIDVTDGVVRVAVNTRCSAITEVFTYPRNAQWRTAGDIDVRTAWIGGQTLVDTVTGRPWW